MKGIVLKASAGTGKTYRLSLEYLATLLKGENYKNILVMTFTKKATSEIQERVILFLEEMYRDKESSLYENLKALYPEIDLSFENVRKVYYEVLDNKDRLKISTIDGFINNIFKNVIAPYLNIFSYEIIDDTENVEILLKCFEKIVEDKNEFDRFKIFLQNRTERSVEKYLEILKKLIDNRWKLILISQSENLKSKDEHKEDISIDKLIKHLTDAFLSVKEKKKDGKDLSDYMGKVIKWILEKDSSKHKEYAVENWNDILKSEKCWDGRRVRTTTKIDLSCEIEILQRAFDELKGQISKEVFNQEILTFEKEILYFIENLYSVYDNIKFNEKRFTHLDISSYMFQYIDKEEINLIKDGYITQYFKDIFDSEFKTVFIDEFQDTSVLQWRILKGLINSCENLICVGDEKQSIYGWRGGEKSLFENLPSIIGVEEETMSVSYRSCKNIVDFTNNIFSGVAETYEEIATINEHNHRWEFTPVDGKSEELGYFEVIKKKEPLEDEEEELVEEDMIETMVDSIEENFSGNYGGIGIIARSNKQLNEISNALSDRKIPFVIDSSDSIIYHRAVNPIFKVLKFSVNRDVFSLLEFLRSDVVKIGNDELKVILKNKDVLESYLFPKDNEESISLSEEFHTLLDTLERIKRIVSKGLDNRNFVLDIIEEFNLPKLFHGKSDLKNIFQFLEMSKEHENIFDFYNSLIDEKENPKFKQVSLEEEKAITLLSIHKSKGLEFETVYYFHQEQKKGSNSGIQFHIDFKSPFNEIENFIFVDKKYEKVLNYLGEDYLFLKELEIKQEQEEINNIYVALTRAKKNLFLVMGESGNEYLKNSIDGLFNLKCGKITRSEKAEATQRMKNIELLNAIDFIEKKVEECEQPNRAILVDVVTEEKRRVGNAIHYYLEFIINNTLEEHLEARIRTYSKYASIIGEERLKNILDGQEFKNFFLENPIIFSEEWDFIYPEYEIYDEGQLKRIDRIMIKKATQSTNGRILVVDYKTGGINQAQLDEYIEIVKNHLSKLDEIENYIVSGEFLEIRL
ncbi:UvrD-helicase domain-containing protein [Candidatus Cetobacterium colombiensis]|uniref:DNA 3'-5' helicase n=1 Tax=Candidatus Cetobacterium colombiensis TaxID=3073100 RepID=A0ABU4WAW1_9FUSO|nr:UvrD-helicase domain-containing protein [Candidatus Cetobacterium colombiensis]MDX8335618.1 UvrD-helicase domain-containing protein [Candidatus Cetobacterium colombiensis]